MIDQKGSGPPLLTRDTIVNNADPKNIDLLQGIYATFFFVKDFLTIINNK